MMDLRMCEKMGRRGRSLVENMMGFQSRWGRFSKKRGGKLGIDGGFSR